MRILERLIVALLFVSASFGQVLAEDANIEGMPIKVGDTYDRVKAAYDTSLAPEPVRSINDGETGVHLKTRGVWFFFAKDGKIDTIRLDAPFHGAVSGVRIGDTSAKMREVLGEPVKTLKPPVTAEHAGYIYYIDDRTTARFDVDDDNKIETVFLFK
jgi:hypothetical protein